MKYSGIGLPGLKALIFTLMVIQHPVNADAQKHEVDAVYLNNGEVFRGTVKDHINPQIIQMETLCLNTRLFSINDISRIEREKIDFSTLSHVAGISAQGYFNRTELGALIGTGNDNNAIFGVQMVNGYKFGRRYHPGIGVGIEFYEQAYIPVFADFSYSLINNRVSPFLNASFGYSIPSEDPPEVWGASTENLGGFLYAAGIGTFVRTGSSSALVISVVYRYQSLKSVYKEEWNDDVLNLEKQFNRIALRIGFMFD